ncbi:MAG: CDP-glycerol glycerophosphotransferase family protein [Lactovum sp.]
MSFFYKIVHNILRISLTLLFRFFVLFTKVDSKIIIFSSFTGRNISDNPRALFEEMKEDKNFSGYRFIWAMKTETEVDGGEVVRYNSLKHYYLLAKAKYWIFNAKMPPYYYKRKEQVYLQTWHGTPLKHLAHDIKDTGIGYYRSQISYKKMTKSYDNDSRHWDFLVTANSFSSEAFSSAFKFPKEKMLETGYPRVDRLINTTQEEAIELKKRYHLPLDKKVILYAPTWRDNSFKKSGYTFDLKVDFKLWKDKLAEDYIVLFKPHYLISSSYHHLEYLEDFVYLMEAKADINDAYLMSDVLVTDYSSVFFDFACLNRPIYFYMYDIEEYGQELRGFYLNIPKDLPQDISKTEDELLNQILSKSFDFERLKEFNYRFNLWNDGNASKKIIRRIFNEN